MRCRARSRRKRTSHCRLHAAKYAATSSSCKGESFRIDRHCPNICTRGDQPAADVSPTISFIDRSESSADCACENVTQRVDRHCVHIDGCNTIVLFRPTVTVVSRSKQAAPLAHERISCSKNLIVIAVNSLPGDLGRGETIIGQVPAAA